MIKHYKLGIMHVIVNSENGEIRYFKKEVDNDEKYEEFLKSDPTFFLPIKEVRYDESSYSKVTLAFNLTSKCNFRCKYCFEDHTKDKEFCDVDKINKIIENFIIKNAKKRKIFIDLSGSGEPLLKLKEILSINENARALGKKYGVEVIVQFVTNGYLLTEKIVKLLQDNAILFGVSLDGTKDNHDSKRWTASSSPTYDVITKNLENIKEKQFLGTAMVLDGEFKSKLLDSYLNMMKYSTTVSVKFKRATSLDEFKANYNYIITEYFIVTLHLVKQILANDYKLLFAILRGDDAFGTMISRVFIENKVFARCNAGIGRFTYGSDGQLYPCSPSTVSKNYRLPNSLIKYNERNSCIDCPCKYYCGGECPLVVDNLQGNDIYLCEIKRKLFEYALYIKAICLKSKKEAINKITKFVVDKEIN